MHKIILCFLLAFALYSSPSHAISCTEILSNTKKAIVTYVTDVVHTKGARLFVKPNPNEEDISYHGFLQYEPIDPQIRPWRQWLTLKPISYWVGARLTGRPDTKTSIISGVWTNLIDRPTHFVTRQFSSPEYRPTFLAKIPLLVAWTFLTQAYVVEPVTDFAFTSKVESEITRHKMAFNDLIQNDYRFRSIKDQLSRNEITTKEASESAYMISQAYSKYYSYRDSKNGNFSVEENLSLLPHYLFSHLSAVMTAEVKKPKGFVSTADFNKTISDQQKERIFQQTHTLYVRYQFAELYALSLGGNNAVVPKWFTPYIIEMQQDPFVAELTKAFQTKKISLKQLTSFLMENYFWNYRLSSWGILGLAKVHPSTNEPVVLADYQAEILKEIQSQ